MTIFRHRWKAALLLVAVVICAAGPHFHIARPNLRCGLPDRNYQYKRFSPTVTALSAVPYDLRAALPLDEVVALPLRPGVLPGTPPKFVRRAPRQIKAFQFLDPARLRIDHCVISEISVLVYEDGRWAVSLRADQNPATVDPREVDGNVTTQEPVVLFSEHLRRNEFYVQVRCFGGYGDQPTPGPLGKPVMIPLKLDPFWVQKEIPYPFSAQGFDKRIIDAFSEIDRVEVDFSYRREDL